MLSNAQQAIQTARRHLTKLEWKEAVQALGPLTAQKKPDPEALFLMGAAQEGLKNMPLAAEYARRAVRTFEHPEALLLLARVERFRGNTDEALRLADKLITKNAKAFPARLVKASALEAAGRFDEAREVVEPMLAEVREKGGHHLLGVLVEWSKLLVQFKRYDEAVEAIDESVALPHCDDEVRRSQYHLRAKALDRAKDYKGSWESAVKANSYFKVPYDPSLYDEQVSVLIENWSAERMAKFPISKCDSPVPVFVAGMPRSGTSLIDQIIDAHPLAAGVGELTNIEMFASELSKHYNPDIEPPECFGRMRDDQWTKAARDYVRYIKKLSPEGAERVVNKSLGNYKLVGLLARLFPNTKIIHAIRDPRDVAISCFMGGFNNNFHAYTTQVDWVAHNWAHSVRLMNHWKKTLDVPILDVHYERLVSDPETEFPRLIEFLGLDWDEKCFEFHKTKRTVRTLSYDQVNRPIYTSSKGRHANYAEFIEGIEFPPYDPFSDDPFQGMDEYIERLAEARRAAAAADEPLPAAPPAEPDAG
ncbi:MAG: sulfotransferase [Phycisphaerales bacterium]